MLHHSFLANTPAPPYYAVIFTSVKSASLEGYETMATLMESLARQQDGFLGMESAGSAEGITISYWRDEKSILQWKQQTDHLAAQQRGKSQWYSAYFTRVCKVERAYSFPL